MEEHKNALVAAGRAKGLAGILRLGPGVGAEINSLTTDPGTGIPVFMLACMSADVSLVRTLLQLPLLDPNAQFHDNTPLMVACSPGHHKVVRLLVQDSRVDVNMVDPRGYSAAYRAFRSGALDELEVLLAGEQLVDVTPPVGWQGLRDMHCVFMSHFHKEATHDSIARLLVKYRADPERTRRRLRHRLRWYSSGAQLFALLLMLEAGFLIFK